MDRSTSAAAPSGRQHEIQSGGQRVVVAEVGAALRSYIAGGHEILDGFDADAMATAARGAPLAPWPNRLHKGQYQWDGAPLQAPLNEPEKNNALHGYTLGMNWVADHDDAALTMTLRLHAQEGYPFVVDLAVRYALTDGGLTVTTTARNVGSNAAPFGFGAHPYLTVGTAFVDDATLHLPARTYLPTDDNQIPTGRKPVADTPYDFTTTPRRIGDVEMDYAFTDLARDSDGRAWLELADAAGERRVKVWADEEFGYLEIFTGDTVPEPERRRRGLGVEPMTCPPNAFATGEDVRRIEPGEEFVCTWGIVPTPR